MKITLSLLALIGILGTGYATTAAAQSQIDVPTVDVRNDADNGFNMGWLGLVGLAGLLGMRRSSARDRTFGHPDSSVSPTAR